MFLYTCNYLFNLAIAHEYHNDNDDVDDNDEQ